MKIIIQNKKALFDYLISKTYEAGIVLTGDEVKSCKKKNVSLNGSFVHPKNNELFLINCNISAYEQSFIKDKELTTRSRKLLLNKKEISKIIGEVSKKAVTLLPLKMYLNEKGKIKLEIGLGKHKKDSGKKQELKEADIKRDTQRELKKFK